MLYREGFERHEEVRVMNATTPSCLDSSCAAEGISVWGERAVWAQFPAMETALTAHPHIRREIAYLQKYYWFHAGLAVLLASIGSRYPALRYLWRMETDVFFTGSMDQLVSLAANDPADVLLPDTYGGNRTIVARSYYHFGYQTFLSTVDPAKRVFALVCVGRFSRRFLEKIMTPKWADGTVGYEEILLPTICLNTTGCTLAQFSGWDNVAGNHVRFRVTEASPSGMLGPRHWECQEFLQARRTKGGTLDLWHPVKDRACVLDALDQEEAESDNETREIVPSEVESAASLRSLRRRSIAWAERWREKLARERPYVALMKTNEARAREQAQASG